MTSIYPKECAAAALDAQEVDRIARGLSRYARQAQALGLEVFGGSGTGTLRTHSDHRPGLVVADIDGIFDGGDGAIEIDEDGLRRGES